MSKVAIITDQHFGARKSNYLFLNYYEQFYKNIFFPELKKNSIDTVLILGDTFDDRRQLQFFSLKRAKEMFFDPLKEANIKVHMLVGNHDIYFRETNEVNSPDLLLTEYDNIDVISTPKTINVKGIDICMIPWICKDNQTQCFNELKETKADICMGHFEISGFSMYRGMEAHDGLPTSLFSKFDKVFSGHYHHRSSKDNISYLGNPYELTWQDYNDPRGFHLFDLSSRNLTFIQNKYKMFVKLTYDDKDKEPKKVKEVDVKDKFIKVIVNNKTDLYKFDSWLNKLNSFNPYDVKIIEDMSEFQEGEIEETINLEDTQSILSNYIDSVVTESDKEKVKQYMKTLYTEALNVEDV